MQSNNTVFDKLFSDPNAHHLSHKDAILRDEAIESVSLYTLTLNLFTDERYQGVLSIDLKMK